MDKLDLAERVIEENRRLFNEEGHVPSDRCFYNAESNMMIHDPFVSDCGRFKRDPMEDFPEDFLNWVLGMYEDSKGEIFITDAGQGSWKS